MRHYLLTAAVAALLTGCVSSGKRGEVAMAVYDLGPPGAARTVERQLPVALEVRAPLWFDSMGMGYRLAYGDASRLREYSRARWAGAPGALIERRLVQELGYVFPGQGRSGCVLRLDIFEFSQHFSSPAESTLVFEGRLTWLERARQPLAERQLSYAMPAASPDAAGAAVAARQLAGRLVEETGRWEAQLRLQGRAGSC